MTFPTEEDFALLLFQLFLLLSSALGLGELFRRLGQPTVIGEILAGILLGPSILGFLAPSVSAALFPGPQTQLLGSMAWLGSVFLLLVAGLEINFSILVQQRRLIALTSGVGITLPFTLGFFLGLYLPDEYLTNPDQRLLFSFFLATALSISAIPIIAKILLDLSLLRQNVGQTVLGAAIVNDLVGWIFFAVILSFLASGSHGRDSVFTTVVLTMTFASACLTFGRTWVARLFGHFNRLKLPPEGILGFAVLIAFLCAAFTQWIGIHAIFGAFLAGVMIGETGEASNGPRELLRQMVFYIFAPIFFASMGLRANFIDSFNLPLVLSVLGVAVVAKFTGGYLGAFLGGRRGYEARAIGFGLMPQGAMGIILAFLALEFALINETVFVALVTTALVTSILSGPLIKHSMAQQPLTPVEASSQANGRSSGVSSA